MAFLGGFEDFLYVPGQAGASFTKKALSKAADFACQLYKDHPGIANPFDAFGFGRGVWDELCRPRSPGLPSTPAPPFTGGQCDAVLYRVKYSYILEGADVTRPYRESEQDLWGAIGVPYAQFSDNITGIYIRCRGGAGAPPNATYYDARIEGQVFSGVRFTNPAVLSVVRLDGLPDDCGNLGSGHPDVILPDSDRSKDITVDNDNGTSFVIPTVVILPKAEVDFNLNVPLTFNMGGLHFYVSADGFHSGEPGGTASPDAKKDAKDIKDKLDDISNPPNPEEDPRLTPTYPPVADSGEDKELSGAKWIKIDLTFLPDKAQYSRSGRTVYFAGWVEFHKGEYALPRMQINYQKTIFRFPDGADGYSYTFTNGAAGTITVYTEEEGEDG